MAPHLLSRTRAARMPQAEITIQGDFGRARMGATPWQILGPPTKDPGDSLRRVQAKYFLDNYDLPALIASRIRDMEKAVATTSVNDEYNLNEHYKDCLKRLREISLATLPDDVQKQIEILREVEAIGSSAVDNILDIKAVSSGPAEFVAVELTPTQLRECFGTDRPSQDMALKQTWKAFALIDRGMCACFPVYGPTRPRRCTGWYFVGYTAD